VYQLLLLYSGAYSGSLRSLRYGLKRDYRNNAWLHYNVSEQCVARYDIGLTADVAGIPDFCTNDAA